MTDANKAQEPRKPPVLTWAERKAKWKAIDPDKPLTRRERIFVSEYAKDMNGTGAVQRCGWKGKNPNRRAHELMQRNNVAKAIEAVVSERDRANEVTVERLVKAYCEFAFAQHVGPILPSHRLQALEALGKHKRMFQPEAQVTVPVQFVFVGAPGSSEMAEPIQSAMELPKTAIEPPAGR